MLMVGWIRLIGGCLWGGECVGGPVRLSPRWNVWCSTAPHSVAG